MGVVICGQFTIRVNFGQIWRKLNRFLKELTGKVENDVIRMCLELPYPEPKSAPKVSEGVGCHLAVPGRGDVCQIGCTSLERHDGALGEFSNRELYRTAQLSIREQLLRSNEKQLVFKARRRLFRSTLGRE